MGKQCSICHCRCKKGCGISFHSFPKDEWYESLWLKACRQSEIQPSSKICSSHFTTDSFESHVDYTKKILKKSAIPTLFLSKRKRQADNLTIAEKINEQPETVPISTSEHCSDVSANFDGTSSGLVETKNQNEMDENSKTIDTGSGPSTPVSRRERKIWRPSKVGECTDFSTPRRAKNCFQVAVRKINEQRKRLRAAQERNRRLSKKISSLRDLLQDLRNKNLILEKAQQVLLDHLESFFSAIRSRGGFNNNPTALQFESAYKKLLVHHDILGSEKGNCSILDSMRILPVTTDHIADERCVNTRTIAPKYHDYFSTMLSLSPLVEDVTEYIAGFVVKKLKQKITCCACIDQLATGVTTNALINIKNGGKLIKPARDVISICIRAEKVIRENENQIFQKGMKKILANEIKHLVFSKVFSNLDDHILSQDPFDNHESQLVNLIINFYLDIRFHHIARCRNIEGQRLTQKLTKLVLFNHE